MLCSITARSKMLEPGCECGGRACVCVCVCVWGGGGGGG